MSARCCACKRELREGESAWASDWTVISEDYRSARRETRYTCEDCEAANDSAPR